MNNSFYAEGLRFECQRCSGCCRHEPGYVYISENDLKALAGFFNMNEDDFIQEYCRTIPRQDGITISLKEKQNYDCIFWQNGGCIVYKVRPFQCRSYPFWENYLNNKNAWAELKKNCPGIDKGRLYSYDEIENWKHMKSKEHYITVKQ